MGASRWGILAVGIPDPHVTSHIRIPCYISPFSFFSDFAEDAVHITAILGEGVIFNCHVEFPNDHPVPYVLQWDKKVSETVRYHS